jgi:Fe-S cluster assembly protein SufD
MTTFVATHPLYSKLITELEERPMRQNTAWDTPLAQLKQDALAVFKEKGFPTIKDEDWRFTGLLPYLNDTFTTIDFAVDNSRLEALCQQQSIPDMDAYRLVLVNGSIDFGLSVLPQISGVTICPLQHIADTDFFREQVCRLDHVGTHALVALNTAGFTDGYFIEIAQGVVVDKPIHIIHLYTAVEPAWYQPRHLVIVHPHARLEIMESSTAGQEEQVLFVNSAAEWVVKENAHLLHSQIQANGKGNRFIQFNHICQERSSRYDNFTCTLPGSDLQRNNLEISLKGSGTEAHLYGLYLVGNQQLTDNHTAIKHIYPACQSNELYKGVLLGNGKGVFNGKVYVDQEAQQTNAYQQNNNLLLGDKAQIYAKPQLEIFADDVKCSHGCTVGQFDPESLFYLRARGIGEMQARRLLIEAFAYDVTEKLENNAWKAYIQEQIYQKLSNNLEW